MTAERARPRRSPHAPRGAGARSLSPLYSTGGADPTTLDRPTLVAILVASLACLAALANRVYADPIEATVRARLEAAVPAGLGIARIYLPASLARLDTEPARVAIELPRELRAGRSSIKLTVRGHRTAWVPVVVAVVIDVAVAQRELAAGDVIADGDIAIERRALADVTPASPATLVGASVTTAIAAGALIAARAVSLPPPLSRGTQIAIDVRRGGVHVRGTGILELAARPGGPASARFTATRIVVHGTLVAPATLIVGDAP